MHSIGKAALPAIPVHRHGDGHGQQIPQRLQRNGKGERLRLAHVVGDDVEVVSPGGHRDRSGDENQNAGDKQNAPMTSRSMARGVSRGSGGGSKTMAGSSIASGGMGGVVIRRIIGLDSVLPYAA